MLFSQQAARPTSNLQLIYDVKATSFFMYLLLLEMDDVEVTAAYDHDALEANEETKVFKKIKGHGHG